MGAPSAGLLLVLALLPARAEDAAEELLDLTYAAEAKSAAQLSPDREADWEALRAMLRGKDAKARVAAIARLGREPDTRAQPILIRHLREDKSAAVRRAAAAGLMRAQGPSVPIALGRAARWDPSPAVRLQAVRSLRESGAAAAARDLAAALGDADLRVRGEAAMTLAGLGDPAQRPALEAARARETNADLRRLLEESLARLPAAR